MRWGNQSDRELCWDFSVKVRRDTNTIFMTRFSFLIFYFTLSLHFTPGLRSAVCILPTVSILPPVCSLRFTLADILFSIGRPENFLLLFLKTVYQYLFTFASMFLKPENLTALLSVRVCHFAKEDFKRDLQVYEYWSW